jgi:hypothetical protein
MDLNLSPYNESAKPIVCRFDDQLLTMLPKRFSTGSVGWYANGKCKILVAETYYPVQVSLTVTIIGSKNSHAQEGTPEAQEGTPETLLGQAYPWNGSAPEGGIPEAETASGIETATHTAEQKLRKRPRKERRV